MVEITSQVTGNLRRPPTIHRRRMTQPSKSFDWIFIASYAAMRKIGGTFHQN